MKAGTGHWALGTGLALLALKVALVPVGRTPPAAHEPRGAYHVHSTLSHDGRGSLGEIAAAARAAGLDFVVLADHGALHPEALGVREGVLLLPEVENSTAVGHAVALGAPRELRGDELASADPLAAIRALGGAPVAAHPLNRRRPFDGPLTSAAGMETLSLDDAWRDALAAPLSNGLLFGLLELPLNPELAVAQTVRRPAAALARFDAERRSRDLAQLCAVDAHGLPGYGPAFRLLSMHLVGVEGPFGPASARAVEAALAGGRAYCALDGLRPASGFRFEAVGEGAPVGQGGSGAAAGRTLLAELPPAGEGAELHLFRDGAEVQFVRGRSLALPATPGDYRVEAWLPLPGALWDGPMVPWILSNPIRLR